MRVGPESDKYGRHGERYGREVGRGGTYMTRRGQWGKRRNPVQGSRKVLGSWRASTAGGTRMPVQCLCYAYADPHSQRSARAACGNSVPTAWRTMLYPVGRVDQAGQRRPSAISRARLSANSFEQHASECMRQTTSTDRECADQCMSARNGCIAACKEKEDACTGLASSHCTSSLKQPHLASLRLRSSQPCACACV